MSQTDFDPLVQARHENRFLLNRLEDKSRIIAQLERRIAELEAHLDEARGAFYEIGYGAWAGRSEREINNKRVLYAQRRHEELDGLVLTDEDRRGGRVATCGAWFDPLPPTRRTARCNLPRGHMGAHGRTEAAHA